MKILNPINHHNYGPQDGLLKPSIVSLLYLLTPPNLFLQYIANLPTLYANESSLREVFSQFGKIINLKILRDDRSRNIRGTAFVRFDRKQEAEEAIRQLNGHALPGATEPLIVKVSEEHGKQKAVARAPKGSQSSYQPASSYGYVDQMRDTSGGYNLPTYGYDSQDWGGGKSSSLWGGGYSGDDSFRGRRNNGNGQYDRKGGRFGGGGGGGGGRGGGGRSGGGYY